MNNDTTYNGWKNYETWNVALHINNDRGDYDFWRENTQHCLDVSKSEYDWQTDRDAAIYNLSVMLQDTFENDAPDLVGTYADLLGSALSNVCWYEIAENLIEAIEND